MSLTFKNLIKSFNAYFLNNNSYFSVHKIANIHFIICGDSQFKEYHTNFLKNEGNPLCIYHLKT
jgi:hypothetical protein